MPPAEVDLILPCLNEAAALPWVLGRLPDSVRAVVVDNGSTGGSPLIAGELGATVVHCEVRGYGAACHAGLQAATALVVAFLDADASLDPCQLVRVTAPVLAQRVDLMLARRRPVSSGVWPWHPRVALVRILLPAAPASSSGTSTASWSPRATTSSSSTRFGQMSTGNPRRWTA